MQNAETAAEAASPLLSELMDAYLADRRNPHAERKCKHPESLACHLKVTRELWGAMTVGEFRVGSKARVKAKCAEWRAAGLSAHTVRKRVSMLKTVFKFAIDEELIERADEPVIKLPPNGAPRERFVDDTNELPALLRAADEIKTPDHIRLLLEILLRTGQRRGCVLDLKWEHVDFERRVIRFRDTEAADDRSKKRRGNKPMDDALYAIMQRAYEARDEDCDHVITWRGKRVKCPYTGMKALYRRAGLSDLRTHDMRRSSATYVNTETNGDLQAAANHINDTVATAKKHYVQEDVRIHAPAMEAVSGVLARARGALGKQAA